MHPIYLAHTARDLVQPPRVVEQNGKVCSIGNATETFQVALYSLDIELL
jgi:hypothetical protein